MKISILASAGLLTTATRSAAVPLAERRQSNWTVGQTVHTESGPIVGHAAPNASMVSEYLGIPFAQPPVGILRFAAPVPYLSQDTINASAFGPACLIPEQQGSGAGGQSGSKRRGSTTASNPLNLTAAGIVLAEAEAEADDAFSEDCLTLNIWTKPQVGESKKAVLIWIYGGGFTSGYAGVSLYNGQYLAESEDVVVVSINYRVNIFGFPGEPSGTQNVGLLDQRRAIEWVRDNIEGFGGDTTRITLFGQSAGAQSIDYYSYAYPEDTIANAFIQESGTTALVPALSPSASAASWYNVSSSIGCGSAESATETVLECMRKVNSSTILAAIGSQNFTPTVDSVTVFSDYPSRSLAGNFSKRPLLLGNNDNEAGIFRIEALGNGQEYPQSYWDAFNLRTFDCPAAAKANVSVSQGVPTWRYRWFGVFANTNLTTYPNSGAYHGSEIPIIFNTSLEAPGLSRTPQEIQLTDYMSGAWAAFAKDPAKGLSAYGWPAYDPASSTLLRLGFNDTIGANLVLPQTYDATCGTVFAATGPGTNGTTTSSGSTPTTAKAAKGLASPIGLVISVAAVISTTVLLL